MRLMPHLWGTEAARLGLLQKGADQLVGQVQLQVRARPKHLRGVQGPEVADSMLGCLRQQVHARLVARCLMQCAGVGCNCIAGCNLQHKCSTRQGTGAAPTRLPEPAQPFLRRAHTERGKGPQDVAEALQEVRQQVPMQFAGTAATSAASKRGVQAAGGTT